MSVIMLPSNMAVGVRKYLKWGLVILIGLVVVGIVGLGLWFKFQVYQPALSGKINILVLGKGGLGHDAPDLTDTMLLVSVPSVGQIKVTPLPRDMWVSKNRAKLNASYYWGKEKGVGGLAMAKADVSELLGVPVDYALVLDFSSFEQIIDALGGIDVMIQNDFVDEKYPIAGKENDLCNGDKTYACRYETISFNAGLTHMDGATALKLVRSRNAQGDEGTDLARGNRQTLVLSAIKQKLVSRQVLLKPSVWVNVWNLVTAHVETDLDQTVLQQLAFKAIHLRAAIVTYSFPQDLLVNPSISTKYDKQYVFVPKTETWEMIQTWFIAHGY